MMTARTGPLMVKLSPPPLPPLEPPLELPPELLLEPEPDVLEGELFQP